VSQILRQTGLKLVMCLNPTLRKEDGSWNTTEARDLLQMLHLMDLDIALEMGYGKNWTPEIKEKFSPKICICQNELKTNLA
jgi:hypothetical protein